MADSEADSDATVGHDAGSEVEETGGEKSPSFLSSQTIAAYGTTNGENEVESSQPMSPELPLTTGTNSKTIVLNEAAEGGGPGGGEGGGSECIMSSGGGAGQMLVECSEEETSAATGIELDEVVQIQGELTQSLHHTNSFSLGEVKMKVEKIEQSLRRISAANKAERKRLASAHSSFSQERSQFSQTGGGGESSERLRRELTSLAARQKTLLHCFKTQKELSEKLDMVVRRVGAVGTIEPKRRRSSAAIPNLLQHLTVQSPVSVGSSVSRDKQLPVQKQNTVNQSLPLQTQMNQSMPLQTTVNQPMLLQTTVNQSMPLQTTLNQSMQPQTAMNQSIIPLQTTVNQSMPPTTTVNQSIIPLMNQSIPSQTTGNQSTQLQITRNQPTPLKNTGTKYKLHNTNVIASKLPTVNLNHPAQSAGSATQTLAVPVALQTLVLHGYLQSGTHCLSSTLMGCEFSCSLSDDGSLYTQTGTKFKTPNQWLQHCWAQLGQHRTNLRTNHTYRNVKYRGKPLMSICEEFNRKQVSIVSSKQAKVAGTDRRESVKLDTTTTIPSRNCPSDRSTLPPPQPHISKQTILPPAWNIDTLLRSSQLLMFEEHSLLPLPRDFWESTGTVPLTPQLVEQFQKDLSHW